MKYSTHLNDIVTKGYLVIPSFLSEEESEFFAKEFLSKKHNNEASVHAMHNNMFDVSHGIASVLEDKVTDICKKISDSTDINATLYESCQFFSTYKGQALGWHLDDDAYYLMQNGYQYLNFYIPIIKPDPQKTNICLIPDDVLKSASSEIHKKLHGKGASSCLIKNNKTIIFDNDSGGKHGMLDYDINEISYTPTLAKGDLLICRGDILHKTQDADTERVAISIRFDNPNGVMSKKKLIKGGLVKFKNMLERKDKFIKTLTLLDMKNHNMTIGEHHSVLGAYSPDRYMSKFEFAIYILWHKVKYRLSRSAN